MERTDRRIALAIDIGASSGRHVAGWTENGRLQTEEVFRFPNGVKRENGHLVWDLDSLLSSVKEGIGAALERFPGLSTLSVDTWGVDYVLMNGEEEIPPCHAYRDARTGDAVEQTHAVLPFKELYRRTGIQFQPFNSVYQLVADKAAGRLENATDFLMIPEYLAYRLTGVKAHEYTNATTTGLVSAETGRYDPGIADALGLPRRLFGELRKPGEVLGTYKGVKVLLCATHDTASAVEGIPMEGNHPFLSSGTWSLLGLKTEKPLTDENSMRGNWSNEGGVGYNRYLKNIMGMWIVNRLRDELCPGKPFGEIVSEAENSSFDGLVDANAPVFLSPDSMKDTFDGVLKEKPDGEAGYFRCAFRSLAVCYGKAVSELRKNTGRSFDRMYIVGGGAKNGFLNRLTEESTGLRVIALPTEATAAGNLKIQLEALK